MYRALQACRASKPAVMAAAAKAAPSNFDYDLIIIGCGVGGHGAALHAVESVSDIETLTGSIEGMYAF